MRTAARVATPIGRKSHVSRGVPGVPRLTHRLGFGPQVPARRVAERGERAVTAWREATRAEGKEPGRRGKSPGGLRGTHLLRGRGTRGPAGPGPAPVTDRPC